MHTAQIPVFFGHTTENRCEKYDIEILFHNMGILYVKMTLDGQWTRVLNIYK